MPLNNGLNFLIFICLIIFSQPGLSTEYAPEQTSVLTPQIQTAKPLPEPLTLEIALELLDKQHPNIRYAKANLQFAISEMHEAESVNDLTATLKAEARWIEPSTLALEQSRDDHRMGLYVNKTLYDFGRSSAQIGAASQHVLSQELHFLNARQNQYLTVMQRYFDVVLADLQYYRYNEEMAVAFIQFDRTQERLKLGQATDTEVAETEANYQKIRRLRTYSQNQQRITRALLAQSLNRPNSLPSTVARAELDVMSRKLPDIEVLQKTILEKNPLLGALAAQLDAAKNKIELARSSDNPKLTGALEAYDYTRQTASTENWRASITLDVPLWSGNKVDAAVAKAKAEYYKLKSDFQLQKYDLFQKSLELLLAIETLQIQHAEMLAALNFSELTLDKNRALYELEVKADLGYSMVRFSEAERNLVRTNYAIALAWAQLDALNGTLLLNKPVINSPQ